MTEYLNEQQVRNGLSTLAQWSAERWTDELSVMWRQVLKRYKPGELAELLNAWSKSPKGQYRPTPGDLARFRNEKRPHLPEFKPAEPDEPLASDDEVRRWLEECRNVLHPDESEQAFDAQIASEPLDEDVRH